MSSEKDFEEEFEEKFNNALLLSLIYFSVLVIVAVGLVYFILLRGV